MHRLILFIDITDFNTLSFSEFYNKEMMLQEHYNLFHSPNRLGYIVSYRM